MGAGPSLDAEIAEAKQVVVSFNEAFVKNYVLFYTAGLAHLQQKRQKKAAEGPRWKLLKCDKDAEAPIRKMGHMLKLSKYLKKWNQRFFVVRGNYILDYWEKEEQYRSGAKPRGSINLSGLRVVRDVNNNIIVKLEELAKKVNLPVGDLPKPQKYPDFTIELQHDRRAPLHLQCANEEEFKSWCDMLDDCRWYSHSLNITDDKVHQEAFWKALWRTRWETDMWGWFSSGGGEVAIIADTINEAIEWRVMARVDAKLTMPWMARSKIRNAFLSSTSNFVTTAVGPAWSTVYETVKRARPEVEAQLPSLLGPITDAQMALQGKILALVEESSEKTVNEQITPVLSPVVDFVFGPVIDSFKLIVIAYEHALEQARAHYKPQEDRMFLVGRYSYNTEFWDADRKMWDIYNPLWELRRVFEDIAPWRIVYKAKRRLRKTLKNALFTFETHLEAAGGADHWDTIRERTKATMIEDCRTSVMRVLGQILCGAVEEFWEKTVIRAGRKLVKPLAEAIPDAVKKFVDPEEMLVELLNALLWKLCCLIFGGKASLIAF